MAIFAAKREVAIKSAKTFFNPVPCYNTLMDANIIAFLRAQRVLTLAVCAGEVYAANCFYALEEESLSLVFASSPPTKHMRLALANPLVAGTIYDPDTQVGNICGVQFQGVLEKASKKSEKVYFKKFPFAVAMKPVLWQVRLEWVKMTDNSLGFGTKISWSRQ